MPRFLVVRFSSIGDIVLTSPVLRCLKQQVPGAEIHFLTKPQFVQVLANNQYIDKLWEWGDKPGPLLDELKKQRFDMLIDLHHNLRSLRVKLALGVRSVSFNKLNFEKYLYVRFKINRLPDRHIVDRYMDTLAGLGVKNDGLGLDYFLPEDIGPDLLKKLPETHQQGFVALVCGALKGTKRMPDDMLSSLCRQIKRPVVLLGGKAEAALGQTIAEACGGNVFNACGKFSLHESAWFVKASEVVLTHDTGLMHIAAAFKKPIVSIWGNTVPAFGMYPYLPGIEQQGVISEVQGLSCRPCSKIGFEKCPKGHFKCMREQDLPAIIRAIENLSGD